MGCTSSSVIEPHQRSSLLNRTSNLNRNRITSLAIRSLLIYRLLFDRRIVTPHRKVFIKL